MTPVFHPDGRRQYRRLDALVPFPWHYRADGSSFAVDHDHPAIARAMDHFGNAFEPRSCEHRPGEWLICPDHLAGHRSPSGEHVPPLAGRCAGCFELHAHRHHEGKSPAWWARALLPDHGLDARIAVWE